MLKNIPLSLSPKLFKVLMEMGHGDEIVIADSNFPAASHNNRLIYVQTEIPGLLIDILKFFPLDTFVEKSSALMQVVDTDDYQPTIWGRYNEILRNSDSDFNGFEIIDRFDFYERAKEAYAIVATTEQSRYANIILKKGIIEI